MMPPNSCVPSHTCAFSACCCCCCCCFFIFSAAAAFLSASVNAGCAAGVAPAAGGLAAAAAAADGEGAAGDAEAAAGDTLSATDCFGPAPGAGDCCCCCCCCCSLAWPVLVGAAAGVALDLGAGGPEELASLPVQDMQSTQIMAP
eukprot:1151198-Pelagomonas_calceolata.AAC.2